MINFSLVSASPNSTADCLASPDKLSVSHSVSYCGLSRSGCSFMCP